MKYVVKIPELNPLMKSHLEHHGIKGQKWGRRRYQNEDGSLTKAGRERYDVSDGGSSKNNLPVPHNQPGQIAPKKSSGGNNLPVPNKPTQKNDDWYADKTGDTTKSFKPGDDGYEIQNGPKNKADDSSSSTTKPKDVVIENPKEGTHFTDKTETGKAKTEEPKRTQEEIHREAEKKQREEERQKKENEREREQNKQEREKEEAEAHKRGEERKKEAEQNKKEAEQNNTSNDAQRKAKIAKEYLEKHGYEYENGELVKKSDTVNITEADLKAMKKVADEGSTIAKEFGNIADRSTVKVPRMNLDHLTNDQMQKAIQREILEKQYDQMFNTTRAQKQARKDSVVNFFKNTGSVITVAGSALGIALAIKQLRG